MFLLFSDMLSAASFSVSAVTHLCAPHLLHSAPHADIPAWAEWPRGVKWAWPPALQRATGTLQRATGSSQRGWESALVCMHVCERDTSRVCSPLTALNSCNSTNDTNLHSKLFVTAGYLTVLLQACWNEFAWRQTEALWPRLSTAKARARWLEEGHVGWQAHERQGQGKARLEMWDLIHLYAPNQLAPLNGLHRDKFPCQSKQMFIE